MNQKKIEAPIKSTTQKFIEIEDVKDDVFLLKDGSAGCIIEVGAVNYWLLSAEEQQSMIYAYANLLNSLSFPIQVLILSKKMNISSYLEYIDKKTEQQPNQGLKKILHSYKIFIKNMIKKELILEKRFFFIVPFSPLELGVSGVAGNLNKEYVFSRAKTSLYPKRDHLQRLLLKIGLKPKVLFKQEVIELFYDLYNPSPTGTRLAPVETYTDVVLSTE
jgi:hypothetical protein